MSAICIITYLNDSRKKGNSDCVVVHDGAPIDPGSLTRCTLLFCLFSSMCTMSFMETAFHYLKGSYSPLQVNCLLYTLVLHREDFYRELDTS